MGCWMKFNTLNLSYTIISLTLWGVLFVRNMGSNMVSVPENEPIYNPGQAERFAKLAKKFAEARRQDPPFSFE